MPRPKPLEINAWSFSRLRVYEECPARAKYQYIDRIQCKKTDGCQRIEEHDGKCEEGKALVRGSRIHKLAEDYVNKKRGAGDLPEELMLFEEEFKALRKMNNVEVEGQLAFTDEWDDTDWFDPDVWIRVVFDAGVITEEKGKLIYRIIDYKTGRIREANEKQLELYALAGFASQGVDIVRGELWYLDQGQLVELEYDFDQIENIDKAWRVRADRMTNDRKFQPTPSAQSCKWCPFSKSKGGPCKF